MYTMHQSLFYFDSHLTPVNNLQGSAAMLVMNLQWTQPKLWEVQFEFPFNLIGKLTRAF